MKLRLFRHAPHASRGAQVRTARGRRKKLFSTEEGGRLLRRALLVVSILVLLLILVLSLRTEPNAMASAEIRTIEERGVLRVGVLSDMPSMSDQGEGLEVELADLLAQRILPDIPSGNSVRYVEVNSANVAAKMADGQIDLAVAMMPSGAKSSLYAYSQTYYEDICFFITAVNTEKLVLQNISAGFVQNSPEGELLAKYISDRPASNIQSVKFASYPDLLLSVMHYRVDVALLPSLYIDRYKNETALNPDSLIPYKLYSFRTSNVSPGSISYAIACPIDTPAVATVANLMLQDMQKDGSLSRLFDKYSLSLPASMEQKEK